MKALSVRQPWAHLIMTAGKDYENRSWGTDYRGPLLIHAGAAWAENSWAAPLENGRPGRWVDRDFDQAFGVDECVVRGALVGHVELVGCGVAEEAGPNSPWAEPYCVNWYLQKPVAFDPPIPWPGRQGLFEVELAALGEVDVGPGRLFATSQGRADLGQLTDLLAREERDRR